MIQRSQGLFISPPLPWITASPCRRLSKTLRLARPCRRYCHRRMDFCFSTRRSSPPAQHFMAKRAGSTVVEVAGSHAIYVSQPNAVATLIENASKGVNKKAGSYYLSFSFGDL